ncbi:MAG: hypothetical protein C0593_02660 [Marinilabiliales bacterium]|nr:MAG: hypothetical protein C0593_02660 [Marinilabiliales bacterium]
MYKFANRYKYNMMKRLTSLFATLLMATVILLSSCDNNENPEPEPQVLQPVEMTLGADWLIDTISSATEEIWYRVNAPTSQKLYVEWSEAEHQGTGYNHTADIKVSAFKLNGEDLYFEDIDDGYGADAQEVLLTDETSILIKVTANSAVGTFGIKVFESGAANITYTEINAADVWITDLSIEVGETIGFLVDGSGAEALQIVWAEFNSPESGYTADIKGSVYMMDGETPYIQRDNGKIFVAKDKSHSDNPKSIALDQGETKVKVHIQLNDDEKPGTYALKIEPVTK